jgi:hypothetical protein
MQLDEKEGVWRIVGAGSEQARIAYATLHGDRIRYSIMKSTWPSCVLNSGLPLAKN